MAFLELLSAKHHNNGDKCHLKNQVMNFACEIKSLNLYIHEVLML